MIKLDGADVIKSIRMSVNSLWIQNASVRSFNKCIFHLINTYSNNTSGLVLKKEINATYDVPKKVENVVHASFIKGNTVYGIGA